MHREIERIKYEKDTGKKHFSHMKINGYGSDLRPKYYDELLTQLLTEFDAENFMLHIKENITLNEEQEAALTLLAQQALEESKSPIHYQDYDKIIHSAKLKILIEAYKLLGNWHHFFHFIETIYPDTKILDMIKILDEDPELDGKIFTEERMKADYERFAWHCQKYREQIAKIIAANYKHPDTLAAYISGAQKTLVDIFAHMADGKGPKKLNKPELLT